jgi:hypothetical protein
MNSWYVILDHGLTNPRNFRNRRKTALEQQPVGRPVFMHGPRVTNFRGQHIKKNRDWSMVCGKKKRLSSRQKFKGDLYWKQCWYHSTTEFSRYNATGAIRSWGYCLLAASNPCIWFCRPTHCFLLTHNWIRTNKGGEAQNFLGAQGRKIPKYGPACGYY